MTITITIITIIITIITIAAPVFDILNIGCKDCVTEKLMFEVFLLKLTSM